MTKRRDATNRDDLPPLAAAMPVRATAARTELAEAALANDAVPGLLADFPHLYTEAGLRRSPIVRADRSIPPTGLPSSHRWPGPGSAANGLRSLDPPRAHTRA